MEVLERVRPGAAGCKAEQRMAALRETAAVMPSTQVTFAKLMNHANRVDKY